MRRIGLLGGSFNPPHAGHLHISLLALKCLKLDQVWWLVSPGNPLKNLNDLAPIEQRVDACHHLVQHPRIKISTIESRLGTRYTVDTVKQLKHRFPQIEFVWIMGADNLAGLHRWKRWQELIHIIPFAIFDRSPFSHHALRSKAAIRTRIFRKQQLHGNVLPQWQYLQLQRHAASSTEIRNRSL
jgi:nicotinate-nucleotide adenylyltransferase